jgi:hypothetical protein
MRRIDQHASDSLPLLFIEWEFVPEWIGFDQERV